MLGNTPAAEVDIDEALVRRLLTDQHPDLAALAIRELSHGWDNVMFRLGDQLTVRVPRRELAAALVEHEQRWLPDLAADLPLPIPAPVRAGRPTDYYPWSWSVLPWFDGRPAGATAPDDPEQAATDLGRFLAALHRPAPADAPENPFRGSPLADRNDAVLGRIASLATTIDVDDVTGRWRSAVEQPPWLGPPMWLHGDLHPLNVLVAGGRIGAVIDFGDITAGDPATDLAVAFSLFDPEVRPVLRAAADSPVRPIDDAMWARAEGWCLAVGLAILANSADDPVMHRLGRRMTEATDRA